MTEAAPRDGSGSALMGTYGTRSGSYIVSCSR